MWAHKNLPTLHYFSVSSSIFQYPPFSSRRAGQEPLRRTRVEPKRDPFFHELTSLRKLQWNKCKLPWISPDGCLSQKLKNGAPLLSRYLRCSSAVFLCAHGLLRVSCVHMICPSSQSLKRLASFSSLLFALLFLLSWIRVEQSREVGWSPLRAFQITQWLENACIHFASSEL